MEMIDMKINVPKDMMIYLTVDDQKSELERNAMLLYPYVKNETLSNGRAAEILGISKWQLIQFYDREGLPYLDFDDEELERDLDTIKRVRNAE